MKRDWNLIRDLLIVFDEELYKDYRFIHYRKDRFFDPDFMGFSCAYVPDELKFITASDREKEKKRWYKERLELFARHIELMLGSGLIAGIFNQNSPADSKIRLTLKGYDLLDFIQYPEIWEKIYKALTENKIPVTYITIMELGKKITLAKIEDLKF